MIGARRAPNVGRAPALGARERAVDPNRFSGPVGYGSWTRPPAPWIAGDDIATDARHCLTAAVAELPTDQRVVVSLHDVHRMKAPAICDVLSITEAQLLRLLHLGRSALRQVLETRLGQP